MLLNLKKVFAEDSAVLPFAYTIDLSNTEIGGYHPFVSPVSITGEVKNCADAALLQAVAKFRFEIPCDRCTALICKDMEYVFSHRIVKSLVSDENDNYVTVKDEQLELDDLLRDDILLELPAKFLCKPGCKGLCEVCGTNLNSGSCDCRKHQIDPRLEVLKKLID